jgi:hypothetical protein
MQPMIGKDAVLLLINHRIGTLTSELRLGNTDQKCANAMITVLNELKMQLDFIQPVELGSPPRPTLAIVE